MEPLEIKETITTPKIVFNLNNNIFEVKGCSRPEDVRDFYIPIINWLKDFNSSINTELIERYKSEPLVFNFKYDYFNSSSAKFILDMLALINESHALGLNLLINWHYDENDDDMKEVGEELSEVVDFTFQYMVEKKDDEY